MLRRMSKARMGLAFGAVAVGLVIWVVWFIGRPDQPDVSQGAASPPVRVRPQIDANAQARALTDKSTPPAPAAPVAKTPKPPPEPAAPAPIQDFHGRAVRASDETAVEGATVIAVQRAGSKEQELGRATTGDDGSFTLHVPGSLDAFQVLVRDPSWAPDDPRPGEPVPVGAEWGSPKVAAGEVRLVLQTGWRLDVRVTDAYGGAREGVVVSGAGRSATTDNNGRCQLRDLSAGAGPLTLTLTVPGHAEVTEAVEPPAAGQLRQDVVIKVP